MKKSLALTVLVLCHLFLRTASATNITTEPALPQNITAWEKVESTCDMHSGKRIVMKNYLLQTQGEIAAGISVISINDKKIAQSEVLIKLLANSLETVRGHIINSPHPNEKSWTKFEFRQGDSVELANEKIMSALGITMQQFNECKF